MRWPFARGEAAQPREIDRGPPEPRAELHRSPGLEAALCHLDEEHPASVLDLGPAVAHNVSFFSRFPCRLRIVGLLDCLTDDGEVAKRMEEEPPSMIAELLPDEPRPVDLVLAWTVFEELDRAAARHLACRLAQLARPGARLYALVSTGRDANDAALDFAIRDRDTLEYRPAARPSCRRVRFNPADFSQLLAGFAVERSVVLRHGFQEYVAIRLEE